MGTDEITETETRPTVAKLLLRRQNFGVALVVLGVAMIFLPTKSIFSGMSGGFYVAVLALSFVITISGIIAVFLELQKKDLQTDDTSKELRTDLNQALNQLSKNYDILRKQTIHGFTIAGIFMALGFLVILVGITGQYLSLQPNMQIITTASGIVVEFISGTALYLYRLNFRRLNQTSDNLLKTWKLLTAFDKANSLSEEKKNETIVDLIKKLAD